MAFNFFRWMGVVAVLAVSFVAGPARGETMSEAVARAISVFPDVQASQASRRAAREAVSQARAGYLPSVDMRLGYGRENSDNPTTRLFGHDLTLSRSEADITLTQLLFDGGATLSAVRGEESRSEAASRQVANVSETVGFRAVQVYLELMRRRDLVALAKDNLSAHQRTYDQVSMLGESGARRRSDIQQAEARLALANSALLEAEGDVLTAEKVYRHVTGRMPDTVQRPEQPAGLPESEQAAVEEGLRSHPAVQAAEAAVAAADADRNGVRGQLAPRVNLELGASQFHDIDGIRGINADKTAMVRLRHNIFRGGSDLARLRESEARRDEAVAGLARARNDTERDVRVAWSDLQTARDRLTPLRTHAESTVLVIESYRLQFQIGQRNLLDVLNAENEYFNARSAQITGEYTVLAGAYRLLATQGRLLDNLGVALPEEAQPSQ